MVGEGGGGGGGSMSRGRKWKGPVKFQHEWGGGHKQAQKREVHCHEFLGGWLGGCVHQCADILATQSLRLKSPWRLQIAAVCRADDMLGHATIAVSNRQTGCTLELHGEDVCWHESCQC